MPLSERETSRLRWGRVSLPGASYFVTACTQNREAVFARSAAATKATAVLAEMHAARDATFLAATIMPDHVHLLFTLGTKLRLGQVVGKFKTLVREKGTADWRWQNDGFEHRLRLNDAVEDYGFYIFMNPYRAELIPLTQTWPWWFCPDSSRFLFLSHLAKETSVPAEWVGRSRELGSQLTVRA